MKNNVFRKYISLVLAFVMVLTLSSVTFATYTDGPSNTPTMIVMRQQIMLLHTLRQQTVTTRIMQR